MTRARAGASNWNPTLGLLFVSLLWGGSFVAVKSGLESAGPLAFVSVRFALAALFSSFWLRLGGMGAAIRRGIPLGVVLAASYATQTVGLVDTTPSRSAFITGAGVVAIPIWGGILLKRRPGLWSLFGLAVAVFGIWLITDPGGGRWSAGDSWTLACAILFSLHVVLLTRYGSEDVSALLASQLLVTSILAGLVSWIVEPAPRVVWSHSFVIVIVITGIGVSFLATLLQMRLQPLLSPGRTAVIFAMEPVFAAVASMLFLQERLSASDWLGGGLIVLGVLLSELGERAPTHLPSVTTS